MSDFFSYAALALVGAFWVAVIVRMVVKTHKNKHSAPKTVTATIIDKSKTEAFSRYGALNKRYHHTVTFFAEGKRLVFSVSSVSYDSYRLNTTGTLTYRGDKLIDFRG